MIPRPLAVAVAAAVAACGGASGSVTGPAPASPAPASAPPLPPPLPVAASPDIDLRDRNTAEARGQHVAFDGIAEGLAWPALDKALGARAPGQSVTIQAVRSVRIVDVLRAAWTARAGDVRVQTPDDTGVMRVVEFGAKPAGGPQGPGCHLAVFLRPDGSLRVAAPGGPREITGERPADSLARSLDDERARCPIKYVAFGAESDEGPWGPVFDVVLAVDRAKSAGAARYVLGQAMHVKK
jgi:hypothetical protein